MIMFSQIKPNNTREKISLTIEYNELNVNDIDDTILVTILLKTIVSVKYQVNEY